MIKQDKLRFGTAGIPISTQNRTTLNGIAEVRNLNLDNMELEFVQSVNISEAKAPDVKSASTKNDVMLTCHGQYFINLNSKEQEKMDASIQRIYKAAKIASLCGAYSLTFHAAFYQETNPLKVTENVITNFKKIILKLKDDGFDNIWIRPETTGKASQWGTLKEILEVSSNFDCVLPCIDFSHIHARSGGKENSYDEFAKSLSMVEDKFGRLGLDNMHIHVAGIAYSDKGEKNHLNLSDSDLNYKELIRTFHDFKIKGCVISESPNIEGDALLLQKTFETIK
ncbi:MAG: TIM barrel protein [Candidatus Woesearchaeota archaeon]|jgi:deoxyribonuclease-4